MKLTKKKATEFCKKVLGTSKGLEQKEHGAYSIRIGDMGYEFWLLDNRIYMQIALINYVYTSKYFNIDTYEHDWKYDEEREKKEDARASAEDRLNLLEYLKDKFFDQPSYKLYNEIERLIEKYEAEGDRY